MTSGDLINYSAYSIRSHENIVISSSGTRSWPAPREGCGRLWRASQRTSGASTAGPPWARAAQATSSRPSRMAPSYVRAAPTRTAASPPTFHSSRRVSPMKQVEIQYFVRTSLLGCVPKHPGAVNVCSRWIWRRGRTRPGCCAWSMAGTRARRRRLALRLPPVRSWYLVLGCF